jgi:hypothetical protein
MTLTVNWVVFLLLHLMTETGFFWLGSIVWLLCLFNTCSMLFMCKHDGFVLVLKKIGIFWCNLKFKDDDGRTFSTTREAIRETEIFPKHSQAHIFERTS